MPWYNMVPACSRNFDTQGYHGSKSSKPYLLVVMTKFEDMGRDGGGGGQA